MKHRADRRSFLYHAGLLLSAPALLGETSASAAMPAMQSATASGAPPQPDPHPFEHLQVRRIAFGSCAHQDKDQPIWDAILNHNPDLFIFLGDNIYGDTRDMTVLRDKYAALAAKPGFRRLRERTPILAVWDDHDYGENDAGAEYPMKEASRQIFCDFFGEPAESPRRSRDGIYAAYCFGSGDQRVQVLLPARPYCQTSPAWMTCWCGMRTPAL